MIKHLTVIFFMLFFVLEGLPEGKEINVREGESSGAAGQWKLTLSSDIKYDDNILQYSDTDKAALDPDLPKYSGVSQASDFIFSPRLRLDFRFPARLRLSVKYKHNFYFKNPVKDYGLASLGITGKFGKGDAILLKYSYLPEFYLRNLYAAGDYFPARFALQIASLKYDHKLTRDFTVGIGYQWENRDYNEIFNGRDAVTNIALIDLDYSKRIRGLGKAIVAISSNYKNSDSSSPIEATSNTLWGGGVRGKINFRKSPCSVIVGYRYYRKEYTTNAASDIHFDRQDERQEVNLRVIGRGGRNLILILNYKFIKNNSNKPYAAFTNNILSLGLRYRL